MQNPNQPSPPPYTDFAPDDPTAHSPPLSQPRSSVPLPRIDTPEPTRYSPQHLAISSQTPPPHLPSYPRQGHGTYPPAAPYRPRYAASIDGPGRKKVQLIIGIDFVRIRAAVFFLPCTSSR
jgi:hypothetical protein